MSVASEFAGRPALRGVLHQGAFFVFLVAGVALMALAGDAGERIAAAVFATAVVVMFAMSALYHRVSWGVAARRWMRRADHAGIYLLIAGSYTPYGLLALEGPWRVSVLVVVWTGVAVAIAIRFAWVEAPGWMSAAVGLILGWMSVVAVPKAFGVLSPEGFALLLTGGLLYSAGGIVYVLRRPDPFPAVFGFHELFHGLVIAAVACHYAAVALLLPGTH